MTNNIRVPAKKSLGQNFLVNPHVLDRIVAAADIQPSDTILEIGPGTGALTERLAITGARIIAVEKDQRLIAPLREKFPNIEVVESDILKLDVGKLDLGRYKVVANIPYYLTSHLIRLALEVWPASLGAILMVQEEVARRMMAAAPDMNLLALSVQLYAVPSLISRVSRNSFRPVPTVDSAVIKLDMRHLDQKDREQARKILEIAKKSFGQKRKQLKATLPLETLKLTDISPTCRPQELSVEQWKAISSALL